MPVPQHVEWAPATPTRTAGEKRKASPGRPSVLRMWAGARTQRPRPTRRGGRGHPDSCRLLSSRFYGDPSVLTNAERTM